MNADDRCCAISTVLLIACFGHRRQVQTFHYQNKRNTFSPSRGYSRFGSSRNSVVVRNARLCAESSHSFGAIANGACGSEAVIWAQTGLRSS